MFSKYMKLQKNAQETQKIEESMLEKLINPKIVNNQGLFVDTNDEDKLDQSEESEEAHEQLIGLNYFEPLFEVKNMFYTRSLAIYEMVAIMS